MKKDTDIAYIGMWIYAALLFVIMISLALSNIKIPNRVQKENQDTILVYRRDTIIHYIITEEQL